MSNIMKVQSSLPIFGTGEKPAVFRNGGIWREYLNLKIPYLGLEMGGGIGWDYNPSRLGMKELIYGTTIESRAQFLIV